MAVAVARCIRRGCHTVRAGSTVSADADLAIHRAWSVLAASSAGRLCCRDVPRSLFALLLVVAALMVSGLPAAAFANSEQCSDDCCESEGAAPDSGADHDDADGVPTCPPLCSACPSGAPAITGAGTIPVVLIRVVEPLVRRLDTAVRPEIPPSDGVFHPPRLRA